MYSLLSLICVIAAVILMIVVLLQSSKGGGLAGITGGSGNLGQMFGTRRTADFLSRSTWWLGSVILVLAIMINLFFLPGQTTVDERESVIQSGQQTQSVPTTPSLPQQTTDDNAQQQEGSTREEQ